MHPYVRDCVLRPTLMRAKMREQSAAQNQSKEDRNHGIKRKTRTNTLDFLLLLRLPSNGTCNDELQVGNAAIYLISTALVHLHEYMYIYIISMQKAVFSFKECTLGKKMHFSREIPKIRVVGDSWYIQLIGES